MTKIIDLPRALVEEIISRVPLKSMRAVRLACKKLDTLSKSESFLKMHIGKQEGKSRMIVLRNYNLYLMSVVLEVNTKPIIKLTCLDEQIKISEVFHCEGLLLCILKHDYKVVVWNPYLGQPRWIETRYLNCGNLGPNDYSYALGYVNNKETSSHSYRILRFLDYLEHILLYELYDFDSGLWKTLDVTATPHWYISPAHHGVSLKGNTYWCAIEKNKANVHVDHIICFDFTRERFGPLLPLPFKDFEIVRLSSVRDENLAVLYQDTRELDINIWISTKVEAEKVSWSKLLTTDGRPYVSYNPFRYVYGGIFIEEEKKVAIIFCKYRRAGVERNMVRIIGEDGYSIQLDYGELVEDSWPRVSSYVPSLVQIKQPATQGKRTQLSLLEELRFDHNILRLVKRIKK